MRKIRTILMMLLLMLSAMGAMAQNEADWIAKAQAGDRRSMENLWSAYYYGTNGVTKNLDKSLYWLKQSVLHGGDKFQKTYLGIRFQHGSGSQPVDLDMAYYWYQKAVDEGYSTPKTYIKEIKRQGGKMPTQAYVDRIMGQKLVASSSSSSSTPAPYVASNNSSYPADLQAKINKAKAGDTQAMYAVGYAFYMGSGVAKDYAQAAYWLEQSAKATNYCEAMYYLSRLYAKGGNGVKQDKNLEFYWIRRCVLNGGDKYAMATLAAEYRWGMGNTGKKNLPMALYWYQQAVNNGHKDRVKDVNELKRQGVTMPTQAYVAQAMAANDVPVSLPNNGNNNSYAQNQQKNTPAPTPQKVNPKQLPNLDVVPNSIAFVDASGNNAVWANGAYKIRLQVKNTGKGAGVGCVAKVTAKGSTNGITTKNVSLNTIPVGGTQTVEIPITSSMNTVDGQVEFAVLVDEPNGFGTDPQYLTVNTRAFVAPLLQITDYSLTSDGGQTLRKKMPFDLQLMLQNVKQGKADDVVVSVDVPQNVLMIEGNAQERIAQLNGGATKSLVYSLIVNNNYVGNTIPIKVHLKERHGRYAEDRTINLSIDQTFASTKLSVDEKKQEPKADIAIARLGSDVDKDLPRATTEQKNTFAVIIANENYNKEENVPYAVNDGQMFAAYCHQTLGIPQTNIHSVKNATLNELKYQIDWLRQVIAAYGGQAKVVFYYAGHGIPDEAEKTAYLLPVDGYGSNVSTGYSLDELYETLGGMPSRSVMVFLDACFSGSKRQGGMMASARGVAIRVRESMPTGNMAVFSAAQGDETAYPFNDQHHGMFTYFLLKKLKATGGNVTLGDLSDYVTSEVKKQSIVLNGKSQTPTVNSALQPSSWRSWQMK